MSAHELLTTTSTKPLDRAASILVLGCVGVIALAYGLRVVRMGAAHDPRVDKQGSSALLSKGAMEMVYWSIQGGARRMAGLGMAAAQVTWAALALGIASGIAAAQGDFGVASAAFLLAGLLDLMDGLVARLNATASDAGEVLDAAVDRYVDTFFFSGLILHYRFSLPLTVLTLTAMAGAELVTYSSAKADALHVSIRSAMMRRHERTAYLGVGACLSGLGILDLGGVKAPMVVALGIIAILANIAAVRRFRQIAAAVRERDAAAMA